MVLGRWQGTIADLQGNVIQGAQITVRREVSGAPLANLFEDRDGTVGMGNPFQADAVGFAAFHTAGGAYRIDASNGLVTRTWRYVPIGTAGERDADNAGNFSFGNISQSGYHDLAEMAPPTAPADNVVRLFAYDAGGRTRMAFKDSAGKVFNIGSSAVANFKSDYGALGDGVANDTVALAAAIADLNSGTIKALEVPDGRYLVNPGHTISASTRGIYGLGKKSSVFMLASAGDFLTFQNAGGTGLMRDIALGGVTIDYGGVNNPTTGRALHLSGIDGGNFPDLDIYGCYQGVDIEGCISCMFSDLECFSSTSWSAVQSGSFLFKVRYGSPANRNSSGIFASNFQINGASSPNRLQSAIVVEGCDGLWMSNGHAGFANFADLFVQPINNASAPIINLEFDNVYFDGNFSGDVNGAGVAMFGSATPVVQNISFKGCVSNIHSGSGFNCGLSQLVDLRWVGGSIRDNGKYGFIADGADGVVLAGSYIARNNTAGGAGDAVAINNASGVSIVGNQILAGTNVHTNGVNIQSGVTNAVVAANVITGHTNPVSDGSADTARVCANRGVSDSKFGYSAGAGGAIVQATSKSTGVTLNKLCGQITMNNAALAAGASANFTLTNSFIASTDAVIVNVQGGGTANAYAASVIAVGSGSCSIRVTNTTGGSLSEAPIINFAVIRAAAA